MNELLSLGDTLGTLIQLHEKDAYSKAESVVPCTRKMEYSNHFSAHDG